jgi:hypothetical protein
MGAGMEPSDDPATWAQTVSEGIACLAVFLCAPALGKLRAEAPGLLQRWELEYAPAFRKIDLAASGGDRAKFVAALAKISAMVRAGVDLDAPGQLAALRSAIREAMTAVGLPLPAVAPADAAICELHGAACPIIPNSPPALDRSSS